MKAGHSQSDDTFPWRNGQHFRLLVEGEKFFPDMLEAIDAAKSHVLVEMYIVESGRVVDQFIEALLRAVVRGIDVQLLLDDYGSRGLLERAQAPQGGWGTGKCRRRAPPSIRMVLRAGSFIRVEGCVYSSKKCS